jgi:hypothetical protein
MPRDYDSDRPKKSWSEIDKQKDRSLHRREERPAMGQKKQARADGASKVYKSQLDRFFEGEGAAPAQVKNKLAAIEDVSPEGLARKAAVQRIKDAATSSAKREAVAAYLSRWELPPDHEVLVEVLACDDDDYIAVALKMIDELLSANRPPRRTTTLEQRLKRIVTLSETPSVQGTAKELIKKLRVFG